MQKKLLGIISILALGALAYVLFKPEAAQQFPQSTAEVIDQKDLESEQAPTPNQVWQAPQLMADDFKSPYGPLPESLKGTRIPFDIQIDENNQLIVTHHLRRLFDYFFTLVGEEEPSAIIARIQHLLSSYLPEPAASQALQVLDEYVELKKAEIRLREQMAADYQLSGAQVNLQERVRLLRELRQSSLSPIVYDAFFSQEDQRAEYSLQRHDVLRDDSLSQQQKNEALRALDEQLPEHLRAAKEEEYKAQDVLQEIKDAREAGVSEEEIMQMRTEAFGAEAAERFAEADSAQSVWDQRVASYRQQRRAIMESALSDADRDSEIERLREQHFSGPELMRIPTIDRMWDQEGKP
ncbi:MAG: hypothetical protein MI867_19000 [Pseudomonadales bacterium]|nr:hypothetical protein [Pseudomonadales bacterium]